MALSSMHGVMATVQIPPVYGAARPAPSSRRLHSRLQHIECRYVKISIGLHHDLRLATGPRRAHRLRMRVDDRHHVLNSA